MKILIIDENYPNYLKAFYSKNNVDGLNYETHHQLLLDDHFANNGSWIQPLTQQGYDVTEVYFNNKVLQDVWQAQFIGSTSNFLKYKKLQTVFLQIDYYKPEILYISNPHVFDAGVLSQIKAEFPYIKAFACYLGTPYTNNIVAEYDICFTTLNKYSSDLRASGKAASTLLPAFNNEIHQLLEKNKVTHGPYQLCFAGGIVRNNDMHAARLEYIEFLAEKTPIQIYSEIFDLTFKQDLKENLSKKTASMVINAMRKMGFKNEYLVTLPVIGPAARWDSHKFKLFPASLKRNIHPPIYGMDMYNTFSENKIVYNIHVNNSGNEAANMRLFEATGAGACLLTDAKESLPGIFVPDEEVITYSSKQECAEKAKWLIANPDKCRAIAQAGLNRTLKDHTYYNRAPIFAEEIKKVLTKKR